MINVAINIIATIVLSELVKNSAENNILNET